MKTSHKSATKSRELTRAERNIKWIEEYCRVPEGASGAGQPLKLREWQKVELRKIYDNPHGTRRAIITFGKKNGKGLALDTPIPTPQGWRAMADICEGDQVYGADGNPTVVVGVSPIHIGLEAWRLTFSDGSQIVADEQHQWLTNHCYRPWDKSARKNGSGNGGRWRYDVVTTPQIAASLTVPNPSQQLIRNHKIRIADPLAAANVALPVDPYVLGAWLGDGNTTSSRISCGDEDVDQLVEQLVAAGHAPKLRRDRTAWSIATTKDRGAGGSLQSALRCLGVLGNKHIPERYLAAGLEQRWFLLQGLMDTDGTVSSGALVKQCEFTSTKQRLAHDVWRLIRTLGLKAKLRERRASLKGRDAGPNYRIIFNASADQPIFRLDRKQTRLPVALGTRCKTVSVVSCEPVDSVPTKCIAVAAKDNLYLAGHGCIPTHNTALAACLLLLHLCGPEALPNTQLPSTAQSKEQAAVLFGLAAKMVRLSPALDAALIIRDTIKQIFCPGLGTLYKALSAEASTAHGLSPIFAVHDELGQVRGPISEVFTAIENAMGAHEHPLSVIISTQAPTDGDLLSILIDDAKTVRDPTVVLSLYTADMDLDPFSEEAIKQANPAYGDFLNAKEVRKQAEYARSMPSQESLYRNYTLNQRVSALNHLFSLTVWEANGRPPDLSVFNDGGPVFGALDLSARQDLTCFLMLANRGDDWHVWPHFWTPEGTMRERGERDRVPYELWVRQGHLNAVPGVVVNYEFVARKIVELTRQCDFRALYYDRWRIEDFKAALRQIGADEVLPLVPYGQGSKDMAPAIDALEEIALRHRMRHGMHPVLTSHAANAIIESDPAGNRKFEKAKASGRIDGMVALAMAARAATVTEPVEKKPEFQMFFLGKSRRIVGDLG